MFAAVVIGLSGCASSTASRFPLNGVDGVSAEGTRNVTKTIAWKNQKTQFVNTASVTWKFWATDYSCVIQPSRSCSFSSRTEEAQPGDIQSTVLQSVQGNALEVTRNTLASNKSECIHFQKELLSQALPVPNGTSKCFGSESDTCDVWRQYTAYKPKSDQDQSWVNYKTEVLYYFKQGESQPVAKVETQIVISSGKTTTIVTTELFSKWKLEVDKDEFSAGKDWKCDEKMAFAARAISV
jgi:hypothetical protein